jgi:hypothetical protein
VIFKFLKNFARFTSGDFFFAELPPGVVLLIFFEDQLLINYIFLICWNFPGITSQTISQMLVKGICFYCYTPGKGKKCPTCKSVQYCNSKCQGADWGLEHKYLCGQEGMRPEYVCNILVNILV